MDVMFSSEGGRFILPEYDVEPEEECLPVVVEFAVRECPGDAEFALAAGLACCDKGSVASGPLACGTGTGIVVERDGGVDGTGTCVVAGAMIKGVCCTAG